MRRILVASFLAGVLCGCVAPYQRAETARQAQVQLRGLSGEQILTCMGVPSGRLTQGQTEVWEYMSGNGQQDIEISGAASGNFASAFGVSRQRSCKIDLIMREGIVQQVNYSGPTGGLLTPGEQCAYAVNNCVKQ